MNTRNFPTVLPFPPPQQSEEVAAMFIENRKRISISGVQEKLSLVLDGKQLRLTHPGEQGTYILKPIPRDLKQVDQVPANEHLTMQIARLVFGLKTAENALITFQDGSPAYITKRFDVTKDGRKLSIEDFATLSGKTKDTAGPNFKYDGSYEEAGALIRRYVPAWRIDMEKFFSLVAFNYLFSNGDAHLKNFSLMESSLGDHVLSPAYDLITTRLHVNDSDFALTNGLFADGYQSKSFIKHGHPSKDDFTEFGRRLGLLERRIVKLLAPYLVRQPSVETMIQQSSLTEPNKRGYLLWVHTKRNHLNAE
jgi:serine/threonine-protein kinase HipA